MTRVLVLDAALTMDIVAIRVPSLATPWRSLQSSPLWCWRHLTLLHFDALWNAAREVEWYRMLKSIVTYHRVLMLSIQESGANSPLRTYETIWGQNGQDTAFCFAYLGSGFAWASPQRCHAASQKLSEWVSQKSSKNHVALKNVSRCGCNFTTPSMTWSARKRIVCKIHNMLFCFET